MPYPLRLKTLLWAAFLAGSLVVAAWGVPQTPWFREPRLARLTLPELLARREAGKDDPLFLLYLGRELNRAGRFAEARSLLESAAALAPDDPRLRDEWARAQMGTGAVSPAFAQLRQFVGAQPGSAGGRLALGKFYFAQRSQDRAAEELGEATRLDPVNPEAWAFFAAAQEARGNLDAAWKAAREASRLRPDNAGDRLVIATLSARTFRPTEARAAFEQVLELAPGFADARREYADFLLGTGDAGDAARAEDEARRAASLDADNPLAYRTWGRTLIGLGRDGDAVPVLARAAALAPRDPAPVLALRQALHRLGRTADETHWNREYTRRIRDEDRWRTLMDRISRDPKNPAPHRELARLLARQGDANGCIKHLSMALNQPPDSPAVLAEAGGELLGVGRTEDALPLFARAGRTDWAAEAAYAAAQRLEGDGMGLLPRSPEMIALARRAVEYAPSDARYLRYLIEVEMRATNTDAAIDASRRLLALAPDDGRGRALLAVLLLKRGRPEETGEARDHLKQAARSPNAAPARWYGLGLLAEREKRHADAARAFREVVRLDPRSTAVYYHLSRAEAAVGNAKAAKAALAEAQKRAEDRAAEVDMLRALGRAPTLEAYRRAAAFYDGRNEKAKASAIRRAAGEQAATLERKKP